MNITIVQGAFLPVPPIMGGAVEKIWYALGKAFAQRGHRVVHISRLFGSLPAEDLTDGVTYRRLPGYDTPGSLAWLKALDLVYSLRVVRALPPADILVTNTFWLPLLSHDPRKGRVYVHVGRYPKGQLRFYTKVARLQTVSSPIAAAARQQAPRLASKIKVIPYFVPEGDVSDHNGAREKTILYVGRVHPEKGIDLLLEAYRRVANNGFSDWRLVIVGPWDNKHGGGGSPYLNRLRASCNGLSDRVELVGPVFESDRLNRYYERAALFVYPSLAERGETFGLAPLEAMAKACPPIVSSLACFGDFVEDGKNGWIFDHRSADPAASLAEKLQGAMADSKTRFEIGCTAARAARNFSLDKVADLYLADFAEVIANSA